MQRGMAICLLAFLLCPMLALSQTAVPGGETTIRVTSRLVYVDVVVRDEYGRIARGLTQQDFRLEEDGKPQTIDFFAPHTNDMAARAQPVAPGTQTKPKLEFTNAPEEGVQAGAVNIILFDLANTSAEDQPYAYKQLVSFLRALPPGQQVTLFSLTTKLTMIQNFTGSSDRLIEAAKQINPKDTGFILSKATQMQGESTVAEFGLQSGGGPGGGGAMASQQAINAADDIGTRSGITLAAMAQLAQDIGGYPGRKNLLWLAGSFPIGLGAQVEQRTHYSELSFVPGAREVAAMIASAQIAVYPISLLGLEVEGVGAASGGVGQVSLGGGNGGTIASQFNGRSALRTAMNDIADQTGGEAFAGTNDFARALQRSMNDGSNYYSLAYRPSNQDWKGQFRRLKVRLTRPGYSLSYRRGYFAYAKLPAAATNVTELNAALQPQMPQATMLTLRSKVELPPGGSGMVRVSSAVTAQSLSLTPSADGHWHGKLLVLLVALQDAPGATQPEAPPQTSAVLNINFDQAQYQGAVTNGVAFTQQLKLPPGRYRLRLGVSDLSDRRLGTLDMPVQVGGGSAGGS